MSAAAAVAPSLVMPVISSASDLFSCSTAIFVYFLLYCSCLFLGLPLACQGFGGRGRSAGALGLVVGPLVFLILFYLFGQIIDSYFLLTPLSFLGLWALSFGFGSSWRRSFLFFFNRQNVVYILFCASFFLLLLLVRSSCSAIGFDPENAGGEKLYNLHFQTAFLWGKGYPPQDTWYAGHVIQYYILPRVFAGLAGFFTWHCWGREPLASGALFAVSDCWQWAVVVTMMACACGHFLKNKTAGILVCLVAFFVVPARSFAALFRYWPFANSISGSVSDMWELSRIIPYTINEYPFWNFLWGDNHSHNSVLWISFLLWLSLLWVTRNRFAGVLIFAFACVGVFLSHSASVVIALCLWSPFCLGECLQAEKVRARAARGFYLKGVTLALVILLPDLLTRQRPLTIWSFVPQHLATGLMDFLNVHVLWLSVLFLSFTQAATGVGRRCILSIVFGFSHRLLFKKFFSHRDYLRFLGVRHLFFLMRFGVWVGTWLAGYRVVTLAGMILEIALLLHRALHQMPGRRSHDVDLAALWGLFIVVTFPEVVAFNFNMGADNIRYNTIFKFYFELYFALPLLVLFVFRKTFSRFWNNHKLFCYLTMAGVLALLFTSQLPAWWQRRTAAEAAWGVNSGGVSHAAQIDSSWWRQVFQKSSRFHLNGLAYLQSANEVDATLATVLAALPESSERPVVLVELCGRAPRYPSAYTSLGRLSALSGRAALCGWYGHVYLFHGSPARAQIVAEDLANRADLIESIYKAGVVGDLKVDDQASGLTKELFRYGVTHVVVGTWERRFFSGINLEKLAAVLKGKMIYRYKNQDQFGIIELNE